MALADAALMGQQVVLTLGGRIMKKMNAAWPKEISAAADRGIEVNYPYTPSKATRQ
jgi:hypothetical protein